VGATWGAAGHEPEGGGGEEWLFVCVWVAGRGRVGAWEWNGRGKTEEWEWEPEGRVVLFER